MPINALIRIRYEMYFFVRLNTVLGNRSMRCSTSCIPAVVSGFWNNLAAHLARSPLNRSYGHASAGDRATCFARLPQKSGS